MKSNKDFLYTSIIVLILIIIFLSFQNLADIIALHRYKKFKNLDIVIAKTIKKTCNKSGCNILFVYKVDGYLFGGEANHGENFRYPNESYYVIYSKDDPTLQIILPDYSVNAPLQLNKLSKDYIIERLKDYSKTEQKEDWGWMWDELFVVESSR